MAQVADHQSSFPKGLGFLSHYDFILSSWHWTLDLSVNVIELRQEQFRSKFLIHSKQLEMKVRLVFGSPRTVSWSVLGPLGPGPSLCWFRICKWDRLLAKNRVSVLADSIQLVTRFAFRHLDFKKKKKMSFEIFSSLFLCILFFFLHHFFGLRCNKQLRQGVEGSKNARR